MRTETRKRPYVERDGRRFVICERCGNEVSYDEGKFDLVMAQWHSYHWVVCKACQDDVTILIDGIFKHSMPTYEVEIPKYGEPTPLPPPAGAREDEP